MTISTNITRHIYKGNGATTEFPIIYKFFEPSDLMVFVTNSEGITNHLAGDYKIEVGAKNENEQYEGGYVVYPYPSGTPLQNGWRLTVLRQMDIVQLTDLVNQGPYYADTVEGTFDYSRMVDQQLKEAIDRCIKFSPWREPTDEELDADSYQKRIDEYYKKIEEIISTLITFHDLPWNIDYKGDLMPALVFANTDRWRVDKDGNLVPELLPSEDIFRNIVPREHGKTSVGTNEKWWEAGYFLNIYGNLKGTFGDYSEEYFKETIKNLTDGLQAEITARENHLNDFTNPHKTDKSQVGLSNVVNAQQATKTEFEANKIAVQTELNRVEAIAKGKSRALVFTTYQQLTDWLNGTYTRPDGKTVADLIAGDNLWIIDRGVPDYWWTGTGIEILETEKVDLSDYPKTAEVQAMLTLAVSNLQSQIDKHRGSKGEEEHDFGDGVKPGFTMNDFTNAEKRKLFLIAGGSVPGAVALADKLTLEREIALTGDATGSVMFDGSKNVVMGVTLANSGIAAGS